MEVAEEELDLELDYDSTLLTAAEEVAPEAATTRREQGAAPAARDSARESRKRGRWAGGPHAPAACRCGLGVCLGLAGRL